MHTLRKKMEPEQCPLGTVLKNGALFSNKTTVPFWQSAPHLKGTVFQNSALRAPFCTKRLKMVPSWNFSIVGCQWTVCWEHFPDPSHGHAMAERCLYSEPFPEGHSIRDPKGADTSPYIYSNIFPDSSSGHSIPERCHYSKFFPEPLWGSCNARKMSSINHCKDWKKGNCS